MDGTDTTHEEPLCPGRTFAAGILMGLANLVPGISGGTMILAVGLYDRFIGAVADISRLRFRRSNVTFLGILSIGLFGAIVSLSGVAVGLVNDHRWVMYSLFVGLTLGGVPELARLARPFGATVVAGAVLGFAAMAVLAWGLSSAQLSESIPTLVFVGALAASSMILPGVSGSYVLLILGMYDLVIGSVSASALREDFRASVMIVGPVVVGAGLGIGLLSNVLKTVLTRYSAVSHAVLLGLLSGSVLGLWPFQEPANPELADKATRGATKMVLAENPNEDVRAKHGDAFDDARLAELAARYAGKTPADLKASGEELRYFRPGAGQVGGALGLLAVGFVLTRLLGRRSD